MTAAPLIELWRNDLLESLHLGHAVICDENGDIEAAWGDPSAVIFPRSSCKMVQALPLLESGAGAHLTTEQLALSCASHQGAAIHTNRVAGWLSDLGLAESDLRCGVQTPADEPELKRLHKSDESPCQIHNNCSGKHAGFLTLNKHLGGGADYELLDHPVQQACKQAFEEVTEETSPTYGIDGCSAPNFATTVHGLARAMSSFAVANDTSTRSNAMVKLREAMMTFPELVAGETRACTELMRAMGGKVAIKTGAEAVFVAILPEQRKGIALKVIDGGTRGAEAAITALLIHLGALDANHPAALKRLGGDMTNWRGTVVGTSKTAAGFVG
ncbi:asparaginase [Nereida sp. MMG025]|uniref:asparaginase n=1 Tax=Nereida sp. MMG025 TaxID=2909981 RepID=UPI001EEFC881|nr:asparaginase [Nereida sp. MMG025]